MRRRIRLITIGFVLLVTHLLVTAQPAAAVIGGTSAGHLRGQVQIFVNNSYRCAGTLIGGNWVLTARHCLDDVGGTVKNSVVLAGDRRLGEGHRMTIAGIYRHPEQDAMLLNLWNNVPNAGSLVVGYALGVPPINSNPAISGWGTTVPGGPTPADFLQICSMRVGLTNVHHDYVGAGDSAMFLVEKGSGVPGPGDSGAGVYYSNRVVGVHIAGDQARFAYALMVNTIAGWIQQRTGIQPTADPGGPGPVPAA
ncbi:trypsin-like serine protease [Micromonospora sp. WMMD882]|uniref:trypsin-like serine protease n=1 Tax=Micromonospora sp. WMMD882 TaxID=3015151 RepID=UPI00248B17BA|nr:trypsin-like serine protease [Micromonospora sp. WMMD882]WBB81671.1 trypsin-like serine protease [Micromonospora sp. WMMD882]